MPRRIHNNKQLSRVQQDASNILRSHGLYFPVGIFSLIFGFMMGCHRKSIGSQAGALVLVGPPGTGKSHLLACAARVARVDVIRFSLADCESSGAGDPASKLQQVALHAEKLEQEGASVLTVIEDFELGLACPQGGEGSSTNRPQIQGVLQELLDGNHSVGGRILAPKRFAFTANDLTAVRASMLREARAVVIEYNPCRREMARIAQSILTCVLPTRVLRCELKRLSHLTVAEIVAVKAELRQQAEQLITFDLSWPAYEAWLNCKRSTSLTDAVVSQLMSRRDVSEAIFRVRERANARRTFL